MTTSAPPQLPIRNTRRSTVVDTPARRGPVATKHLDILWAAVGLFAARGVAQTSTRDIAAAARTTERTLFKHFGNKDGLVQAVITEAVIPHLAPQSLAGLRDAIQARHGDLASWHRALLIGRSQQMGQGADLARLLLMEIVRDRELREQFGREWASAVWRPLCELFAGLQAQGRLRRDIDHERLARMFLSLNLGFLVGRHLLAPDLPWSEQAEIEAIAALFEQGGRA